MWSNVQYTHRCNPKLFSFFDSRGLLKSMMVTRLDTHGTFTPSNVDPPSPRANILANMKYIIVVSPTLCRKYNCWQISFEYQIDNDFYNYFLGNQENSFALLI